MFNDPQKRSGVELYEELQKKYYENAEKVDVVEKKSFWQRFEESAWDLFQGKKEKKWSPDRRPENERGFFDVSKSTLCWGRWNVFDADGDIPTGDADKTNQVWIPSEEIEEFERRRDNNPLGEASLKSDDVSESFIQQIQYVADFVDLPNTAAGRRCSGRELAELCFAKYGYYHDIAILQTKPFGDENRQVAVNIYGPYLGLPDFPMTESQFLEKLDGVAEQLNAWDQAWFVKKFFREPVYPRRGLPSRPRFDTAVTLRLNTSPTWKYVPDEMVSQWFSY